MDVIRLLGFGHERGIRLASDLARAGIYAERATGPESSIADADLLLLDGGDRKTLDRVLATWPTNSPACPAAALFPVDEVPLGEASLLPGWLDPVPNPGLLQYLEQRLGVRLHRTPGPNLGTAGFTVQGGRAGIARIEALGPCGVVFRAPGTLAHRQPLTFHFRLAPGRPFSAQGTVVGARRGLRRRPYWVASFDGLPAPRRRALGRLLADLQ